MNSFLSLIVWFTGIFHQTSSILLHCITRHESDGIPIADVLAVIEAMFGVLSEAMVVVVTIAVVFGYDFSEKNYTVKNFVREWDLKLRVLGSVLKRLCCFTWAIVDFALYRMKCFARVPSTSSWTACSSTWTITCLPNPSPGTYPASCFRSTTACTRTSSKMRPLIPRTIFFVIRNIYFFEN